MPCRPSYVAASVLVLFAGLSAVPATAITYVAKFEATWSAATHPGAYPAGAHFSALIGGVHNDEVEFWTPGGMSSPGIEQMAEVGGVSALRGEVQAAIDAGNASAVIQGSGVVSPGSTTVTFDVWAAFPLVTIVTMVAPTPDWFVGVHGFDLRDDDGWVDEVSIDLFAYDAGTEEGLGFSLANPPSDPYAPIALLQEPLGPDDPKLAVLTFTRVAPPARAADFDGSLDVDGDDLDVWRAGFGTGPFATRSQGDADADGDVDGADYLVWQRQLGFESAGAGAAHSAPEPASLAPIIIAIACGLQMRARPRGLPQSPCGVYEPEGS
jgi:hypothetical protein